MKPNQSEEDQEFEEFVHGFNKEKPVERKKSFDFTSRRSSNAGIQRKNSTPQLNREFSLLPQNLPDVKAWPSGLRKKVIESFRLAPDERKARELLTKHRWPEGLMQTVFRSCRKLPLRFFIVDDSGNTVDTRIRQLRK